MPDVDLAKVRQFLDSRSREERQALFHLLRREFPIHELEQKLNTSAEVILEAISRASDLTLRGIRGIIAEAAFKQEVLPGLSAHEWADITPEGDHPFDFLLEDSQGRVSIQVKMQRQKDQRPMLASEGSKKLYADHTTLFVVETQRTRGGTDKVTGVNTRPYKFGEFDILAVAMHPSTKNWSDFMYTVERWLVPDPDNASNVFKYQPVSPQRNGEWTGDLVECIGWFRSGEKKTICAPKTLKLL